MGRRPDRWTAEHRVRKAHQVYIDAFDAFLTARDAYIDAREEKDQATEHRDSAWFSKAELKVVRTWTELDEAVTAMKAAFKALRTEHREMNSRGSW